jgi:hypothetical protein
MRRYEDYKSDKDKLDLSIDELAKVKWTKFKIVVPTEADKDELIEAIEHIHFAEIDTEFVTVNQIAHEYLEGNNIIVSEELFNQIEKEEEEKKQKK